MTEEGHLSEEELALVERHGFKRFTPTLCQRPEMVFETHVQRVYTNKKALEWCREKEAHDCLE